MNEDVKYLNLLLPIKEMYLMYEKIGNSIITKIDVDSYTHVSLARINSLCLFLDIGIVYINNGKYYKKGALNKNGFIKDLVDCLYKFFKSEICSSICGKQKVAINSMQIYISRNDIPLCFAGLFMLLDDLDEIKITNDKVVLIGNKMIKLVSNQDYLKKISLIQLEESLKKKKEIGEEAEKFVLKYEMDRLRCNDIFLSPIQISLIDVAAGFDIVSYNSNNPMDKRYIEVKSCDNNYDFYLSLNEIETAKNMENSYYLYLFNRIEHTITILQNPYYTIFKESDNRWAIEPSNYRIHRIM